METFEKQWYVLHTYSGYENKVKENLLSRAQSMGMEEYIFRVCVPEEEERGITKTGKEKITTHKIFPGYVLVEMIMTDESWYIVRNTPGVTGFVGSHGAGSKPAPLLPDEVDTILNEMDQSVTHERPFAIGEKVRITSGSFEGFTGEIKDFNDEEHSVYLVADMGNTNCEIEVGSNEIEQL